MMKVLWILVRHIFLKYHVFLCIKIFLSLMWVCHFWLLCYTFCYTLNKVYDMAKWEGSGLTFWRWSISRISLILWIILLSLNWNKSYLWFFDLLTSLYSFFFSEKDFVEVLLMMTVPELLCIYWNIKRERKQKKKQLLMGRRLRLKFFELFGSYGVVLKGKYFLNNIFG